MSLTPTMFRGPEDGQLPKPGLPSAGSGSCGARMRCCRADDRRGVDFDDLKSKSLGVALGGSRC